MASEPRLAVDQDCPARIAMTFAGGAGLDSRRRRIACGSECEQDESAHFTPNGDGLRQGRQQEEPGSPSATEERLKIDKDRSRG